jgi:hypothetical protein
MVRQAVLTVRLTVKCARYNIIKSKTPGGSQHSFQEEWQIHPIKNALVVTAA